MKKKFWRLRHRTVFSRDTCWWATRHHYLSGPGRPPGGWVALGSVVVTPLCPRVETFKENLEGKAKFAKVTSQGY